jgi:hypothetical protein
MATKTNDEQFSDEEAQRRLEASLRGARAVGHEAMKDISPKRHRMPQPRTKKTAKQTRSSKPSETTKRPI